MVKHTLHLLRIESVTGNVNYNGDDKYNPASTTVKITVNPKSKENLTIEATAKPITVGEDANVIVTGLKDATGEVTVTIGSNKWTGKINKVVTISIILLQLLLRLLSIQM